MAQLLNFQDIDAPVAVDGDAALLRMVPRILPGWPYETLDQADTEPFFTITGQGPEGYHCTSHITGVPTRKLDTVDAICDVVAAMSYGLVASRSRFLCLHAAAIEIGGRLIVVPSTWRAGKSTLTAALAHDGHGVFTDDALTVTRDANGRLMARASGICPRVRLPFPEMPGAELGDWVARNPGPANERYKYLCVPELPTGGHLEPLGAIVMLERTPDQAPALTPVDPETAMDSLLFQNFTREVHSAMARIGEALYLADPRAAASTG